MLEFKVLRTFFFSLNVPLLPKHHCNDSTRWVMVECMHKQVIKRVKEIIASSKYLALSCDEVTTIDNRLWISIYSYIVQDWCCILVLISLKWVIEGGGVDNQTKVIMGVLKKHGGFFSAHIAGKLISFGANGVNVF